MEEDRGKINKEISLWGSLESSIKTLDGEIIKLEGMMKRMIEAKENGVRSIYEFRIWDAEDNSYWDVIRKYYKAVTTYDHDYAIHCADILFIAGFRFPTEPERISPTGLLKIKKVLNKRLILGRKLYRLLERQAEWTFSVIVQSHKMHFEAVFGEPCKLSPEEIFKCDNSSFVPILPLDSEKLSLDSEKLPSS